jgi:hypothetical protein
LSRFIWLAVASFAVVSYPASAHPPLTIQQLAGEWRITSNDVAGWDEPGAVLAYGRNDPTVVGGKLIIGRSEIRFVDPKRRLRYGEHRAFSDYLSRCASPVLRDATRNQFKVWCAVGGRFGPEGDRRTFTLLTPTKMRVEWYDGLTMYLTKAR